MNANNCYIIGLTGGIASGKSAVSQMFEDLGCEIIDADIVARDVVKPKSKGLTQVVKIFGPTILSNDKLDRAKLRQLVFSDSDKLSQLNSILHPLIKKRIIELTQQITSSFCIVVIPLLCESNQYEWLDRVVVVDVSPETQMKRLLDRDSITQELANKMMSSQCTRKQRLLIANDVINNEQSLLDLKKHIEILNCLYKSL